MINYGAAGFRYNTEGNVTSAGIYITSYEGSGGNFNAAVDLNS